MTNETNQTNETNKDFDSNEINTDHQQNMSKRDTKKKEIKDKQVERYSEQKTIKNFLSSKDGIEKILSLGLAYNTNYKLKIDNIIDLFYMWQDNCSIKKNYGKCLYERLRRIEDVCEKEKNKYAFMF